MREACGISITILLSVVRVASTVHSLIVLPSTMSAGHYDAVVVGLGGVGSFALRSLAKYTGNFLGVEAASLSSAGYSSQGKTRIYRRAYFEHEHYVPWIKYSLDIFKLFQEHSGENIMRECGTLLLGPEQDDAKKLPPLLESAQNSAAIHNLHVEYLNAADLRERFPQFQYKHRNMVGLLEPGGGLLRPEKIMQVALKDAVLNGVTVWEQTQAKSFQQLEKSPGSRTQRVELHMVRKDEGDVVVTTDNLLLAMGGWTSQLLPTWKNILHPVPQLQGWIDVSELENRDLYSCENMPSFVYVSPDLPESLYGVPCDADEEGPEQHWFKVGVHRLDIKHASDPPNPLCPPTSSEDKIHELAQAIPHAIDEQAWNNTGPTPSLVATKPCLYTVSPDQHFVIGVPRCYREEFNVYAVAGLSGHGYKMAPALGEMMADFAVGNLGGFLWDTDFCSPYRFRV